MSCFLATAGASIPGLDEGFHGTDGAMMLTENPDHNECSRRFVEACEEIGLKKGDYNGMYSMSQSS